MKKTLSLALILGALVIILVACENKNRDVTPPQIDQATFLPADCDIYYLSDTMLVHFVCSDDSELGNYNIEIHSNFDHHTHGTSGVDCEDDEHDDAEHEHEGGAEHEHEAVEGAWVYNHDFSIDRGKTSETIDLKIAVPADVAEGDYHFMLRLTDRAGWQTIKAVAIHLHRQAE